MPRGGHQSRTKNSETTDVDHGALAPETARVPPLTGRARKTYATSLPQRNHNVLRSAGQRCPSVQCPTTSRPRRLREVQKWAGS